ncbi:MAG: chemotaxis protein MotA [Phenylobacterium sp.]|jgi:chemotaxis protein MotA
MDKLSLLGIVTVLVAVLGGFLVEGGSVSTLFQFPAFLIVFGGTLGAVMLQSSGPQFVKGLSLLKWVVIPPPIDINNGIARISHWASESRQHGFLVLESEALNEDDDFTSKGLNLLVDGVEPEVLRNALDIELSLQKDHLLNCARIYESMGGYSPTVGIIGAVLGLIQAMSHIKDPQMLAVGIATAFVATIYGVGFANFIYLPVANKLKHLIYQQMLYKEMLIEGIYSIANGESPRSIELKLSCYQLD